MHKAVSERSGSLTYASLGGYLPRRNEATRQNYPEPSSAVAFCNGTGASLWSKDHPQFFFPRHSLRANIGCLQKHAQQTKPRRRRCATDQSCFCSRRQKHKIALLIELLNPNLCERLELLALTCRDLLPPQKQQTVAFRNLTLLASFGE